MAKVIEFEKRQLFVVCAVLITVAVMAAPSNKQIPSKTIQALFKWLQEVLDVNDVSFPVASSERY